MSSSSSARNKHKRSTLDDNSKLDITQEEFARIREALGHEEFRKLFLDYVEEIQDPENRKIYEKEITEFEKERGVEVTFLHPKPGFVVKTSIDGELKCFINIASCIEIASPSNELVFNSETDSRGLSWVIPYAHTGSRDDVDAKGKRCKVYDVVFHPDALQMSQRNGAFRKCLIDTALDAVEREFEAKLDRINVKYPKLEYKGIARPTVIRKLSKNATPEEQAPHPLDHVCPARPTADSGKPKVLPVKTKATVQPEFTTPNYVIKHSHNIDLAEYTDELDAKLYMTVPRALIVEIELPLLKSAAECQLDVTNKSLYLLSERAGAKYRLKIDLPYIVNDKEGAARFDTNLRRLCITLPVVRSSVRDERDMHDMLRNLSREDSGVELTSNSESPVEEEEEEVVSELADNSVPVTKTSESDQITVNDDTTISPRSFLKNSIHYQFPTKFDCNVLDNVMSFVLHVRNVQAESIETYRQSDCLHLTFATIGNGYYPTYYAFFVKLPNVNAEQCLKIDTVEAEAWENNVVLNLNLNTSSEQLRNYLAGRDENQLKEYKVHSKFQLIEQIADTETVSMPIAPTLHVSVERTECASSVEIKIKPLKKLDSINTTTEDDENDDEELFKNDAQHKVQKKQSKKQRKRNKKRQRSLSESACDDIKAYQNNEQKQNNEDKQQIKLPSSNEEDSSLLQRDNDNAEQLTVGGSSLLIPSARKQRSYSECHDSVNDGSLSSGTYKSILKRFSRYGPQLSDSCCSSIDDYNLSTYSRSVDAGVNSFPQSFDGIPEEHDDNRLSESCKKTVRFNDHIMKQVFRHDSSILGQRKKNQKRRDRKIRAQQRRLSEGDSADYEDNNSQKSANAQYFKNKNNQKNKCNNNEKTVQHYSDLDINSSNKNNKCNKNNKQQSNKSKNGNKKNEQFETEASSSDAESKNTLIFEMDDDI